MIKEIISSEISNILSLHSEEYNEKGYYFENDGHEIYYEVSGNEYGIPVVFVHGGPGSPMGDYAKRFFNKDKYRIIVIDQRGCGMSKPFAKMKNNNTFSLIDDMEKIREKLSIDKWIVFGGSWGSTLSLVYAINHPERVLKLVLRGIFLARDEDVDWLYKEGASYVYPEEFEKFISPLTIEERKNPVKSYLKYLQMDLETAKKYAKVWSDWEHSCVRLIRKDNQSEISKSDISMAIIECTYFNNNSFLPTKNYILENTNKIENIEIDIVHGRYDVDCRLIGAYDLYKQLNNANLYIIQDAGHSSLEKGITHKLMEIMEEYSER
ncbi:prolyl aminopeptidase [Streptobacillus felis]|uniref:Proline iminopeptidase n=1 Tax=Streptobacillus felis TaxID=1384509 RepID=A0A7Z0PHN8_9FUSO|nr:prolyl aminopeptidase [Streptobacillus felis]NYV28410.1 prolyl aminopeptidase [Streptobacillus felis]